MTTVTDTISIVRLLQFELDAIQRLQNAGYDMSSPEYMHAKKQALELLASQNGYVIYHGAIITYEEWNKIVRPIQASYK